MKTFTRSQLELLPLDKAQAVVDSIGRMMVAGFDESGGNAFVTESCERTRLIKKVPTTDDLYINVEFNAENYPAFNVTVIQCTEQELKQLILEEFIGWYVKRIQFKDIRVENNCVEEVMGYQLENADSENFEHESFEVIQDYMVAVEMLERASNAEPDSGWKIIPIYEDTIEGFLWF